MSDFKEQCKVVTKWPVHFHYVSVFEPAIMKAKNGQVVNSEPKYKAEIRIPKENTALVAQIQAGVNAAKEVGKITKWGGKIPYIEPKKNGLRDGDVEKPNDPSYKGMWFMQASNKNKPAIVSQEREEFTGKLKPITDPVDFYSGCWGLISLSFFPYSTGGDGIGVSLQNIMKTKPPTGYNDDRVAGGASADEDFASFASGGDDDFMK